MTNLNEPKFSIKQIFAASVILALALTSSLFIGIQIGSQNIGAYPNGVESAALPVSKGGTGMTNFGNGTALQVLDGKGLPKNFLGTTSTTALAGDTPIVKDIGNIGNMAYSSLSTFITNDAKKYIAYITPDTTNLGSGMPIGYYSAIVVMGGGYISVMAQSINTGRTFSTNYNSGNPTWGSSGGTDYIGASAATANLTIADITWTPTQGYDLNFSMDVELTSTAANDHARFVGKLYLKVRIDAWGAETSTTTNNSVQAKYIGTRPGPTGSLIVPCKIGVTGGENGATRHIYVYYEGTPNAGVLKISNVTLNAGGTTSVVYNRGSVPGSYRYINPTML
ncbi:MAG: hypothetical protein LBN03_00600 [Bifidobacteriaceae bacterium]|jgi:hypothetical protein|nr:hypothetical protein [Bifidobacteriaceae bacterium]